MADPSATDWVQTITGAGGVIGGLWLYSGTVRDRRRLNASKVHPFARVWNEHHGGGEHTFEADIGVRNGSELPVYWINVKVFWRNWRVRPVARRWMKLDDLPSATGYVVSSLLPGDESKELDEDSRLRGREWAGKYGHPPLFIEFTDGAGRRWRRWPDGKLTRYRRHARDGRAMRRRQRSTE